MDIETTALVNPAGNMEKSLELCRFVKERRDEVLAEIRALNDSVTAENATSKETASAIKRLAEVVEDLREKGKELVRSVVAATEAQRVLTAIDARLWNYSSKADPDCAYAKLSDELKKLKAKVADFKAADAPQMPVRKVALVLYATDKGVADLSKKIKDGKFAGVQGYQFAPDEATEKKCVKLIEGK